MISSLVCLCRRENRAGNVRGKADFSLDPMVETSPPFSAVLVEDAVCKERDANLQHVMLDGFVHALLLLPTNHRKQDWRLLGKKRSWGEDDFDIH